MRQAEKTFNNETDDGDFKVWFYDFENFEKVYFEKHYLEKVFRRAEDGWKDFWHVKIFVFECRQQSAKSPPLTMFRRLLISYFTFQKSGKGTSVNTALDYLL